MNDYANFYRQIAEMERQATRGQRRNRASIGPGPAWERTPEANGGRGQPLPQQAPEWSSALRSARVSQGMAPEATDQPLDPVALARLRGETLEQRYSPLSEDWGWLDLPAGLAVATGDTFVDSLASPFSEGARQRNEDRRQMLRDAGEGVVDALDSWTLDNPGSRDWDARSNFWEDREGATNLNELFSGSPGQQRRADVQQTLADMDARSEGFWVEPDLTITAESRPDTLTRLGAVGSDLWRGPSEAARTGRREYPVYLALEQQAREAGDVAAADEYGRMANAAALSDAVNTGSGALEAAPGTGLADTLLGLGRFTGRQVLRAAGREIPYYMNPVDWSSTAAYAGRADEAMLDPGMLTRQAEPIRNAVLAAPVGAVAADLLMDGDAGDANQLAGGALITGGAIAGLPMALRGGEEFVRGRLGRTDPLADIAPRVADDAPFAFEGAPQAGRVIDAEATPAPARNFEAAVRDPETGQVYRGQDHLEAIDSAPDEAVRARLQAAYDAVDEDPSIIGFQVDGEFMGREQGMDALRARAGRSRQVRIGEQVNRDGTVTPRTPIDWNNPNTRLFVDDEWFNALAGVPTPPRMNIVPEGGIPGRSADDILRDGPDAGSSGARQVLEGEVILPNRAVAPGQQGGSVPSVVGALEPMIPEMRAAQADIRRVLGDEEYFAPRQPIDVDALEPNRRAIARASVALEEFVAQNRALRAEQAARALPDGNVGREELLARVGQPRATNAPDAGPRRLGDAVRTDAVPEDLPPLLARNPNTDEALARFRENEEGFRRALDNGPPEGNSAMPRRRLGSTFDSGVNPERSPISESQTGTEAVQAPARAEQTRARGFAPGSGEYRAARNARILELIEEMQPVRNARTGAANPNARLGERLDNGYRAIAERLRAEGYGEVTASTISGVVHRNRPRATAAATVGASDEAAAQRLGMSVERYRALSARRRAEAVAGLGIGAGAAALAFGDDAEAADDRFSTPRYLEARAGEEEAPPRIPTAMRLGGAIGAGLIVRNFARRLGLAGSAPDLVGAAGAGLANRYVFGGSEEEAAATALATPVLRYAGEQGVQRVGRAIDDYVEREGARSMDYTAYDHHLANDPYHQQRVREFAMSLPGETPRARVMQGENYSGEILREDEGLRPLIVSDREIAEQGYSRDLPGTETLSPRDEFLAMRPWEQEAFMDRQHFDVAVDPARVEEGAATQRRIGAPPPPPPARGMPPMNRTTRGERTGGAVLRRAGTRPAGETMGGFIEAARREGVVIERVPRNNRRTAENIARAVRENPRLEQLARDWGLAALLTAGGVGALGLDDAEASTGGAPDNNLLESVVPAALGAGAIASGPVLASSMRNPGRMRLGQTARFGETPFEAPTRMFDVGRSRLGRVAPNRVASDVDPRRVAFRAALAAGPIAWGAAELLDPTAQSPQEQDAAFLRNVMPYFELRQQALELYSQGYTSREIRDIDPEIADEMLVLEQGGNSLLNDYEISPAETPEDIQAARASRAREEQKRNPQRLGR